VGRRGAGEVEETERAPARRPTRCACTSKRWGGPLLSREEEVAIAKEIETGEREVREGVFSLELALQ